MKPNIVDFSTSELNQVAFLCWILEYADKKYAEKTLHVNGSSFISYILDRSIGVLPYEFNIETVKVERQRNGIDICVTVNDTYFIIIANKINANEHGNELTKYKELAKSFPDVQEKSLTVVPVYLETSNDSKLTKKIIAEKGYWYFGKEDILLLCTDFKYLKNDIVGDFFAYLKNNEIATYEELNKNVNN